MKNRVIKFKAWDKKEKKMYVFDLYEYMSNNELAQEDMVTYNGRMNGLMQFTGMYDSKGVEIYEGDLVKIDGWSEPIQEVLFNRGGFCTRIPGEAEQGFYHDIKYTENSEVIGNIYENPELLSTTPSQL